MVRVACTSESGLCGGETSGENRRELTETVLRTDERRRQKDGWCEIRGKSGEKEEKKSTEIITEDVT